MRLVSERRFKERRPANLQIAAGVVLAVFLGISWITAGGQPRPSALPSATSSATCDCPHPGDPNADGWPDVYDLMIAADVAFNRKPAVQDPLCPVSREDFDGDGQVDALDVYLYWTTAFDMEPCQPCSVSCSHSLPEPSGAGNSVVVESKKVLAGGTGQKVAVRISNSNYLQGVVVPLQFREVTPGAFPTALRVSVGERIVPSLLLFLSVNQFGVADGQCGGSGPAGYSTITALNDQVNSYPVTGPKWGVLVAGVWIAADHLSPGSDSSGSIQFTMNISNTPGIFEVDTTCTDPANHLLYLRNQWQSLLPSFTKGTEEIVTCLCPWQGDLDANGVTDVFDVIELLNEAFSGGPPIQDPGCPTVRADYNGDLSLDVYDVIALIDGVFSSGPPPKDPCT